MTTRDDELKTEDLARRITETRAASSANAFLGLWAFWLALLATVAMLTGAPWLMMAAGVAAWTARAVGQRAEAAVAASMLPDIGVESLGTLLELLEWPSRRVRDVARWRIAIVLRTLPPGQQIGLGKLQLARLYDALTPATALQHPWLVESVIGALPSIADADAIPAVTRLVRMKAWTRRLRRIRAAARASLPHIERRVLALRADGDFASDSTLASEASGEGGVARTFGEELGARPQMRFGFLLAAWTTLVPACLLQAAQLGKEGRWLDAAAYAAIGLAATQLYRVSMLSRHARMARELMNENRVEAIGRLAEAAVWPDARLKAAAISALTRLLPRLKASDARLLTSAQRGCLYSFLSPAEVRTHPELVAALLGALEQVGDMAAVPYVRSLAQMPARSARMAAIRDAAEQCLPTLMERARLNTDHQTLLRPAEAPGLPEETLLRPAMPGAPTVEAALLVRPADPEADDRARAS